MNNQKGLTLLEVLAAIAILALVILSVSYLFSKTYQNSYKEEKKDFSVNVARTVIEEIKQNLKTTAPNIAVYEQNMDLTALRNKVGQKTTLASIYYPTNADRQYEIKISNLPFPDQTYHINDQNNSFNFVLSQYFSLIEVEVLQHTLQTSYTLQSYIEKR